MPDLKGALWALAAISVAALTLLPERERQAEAQPARAEAPPVQSNRITLADERRFPGAQQPVESLLRVPERMRYGQFVWDEAGVPAGPIWVRVDRKAQIISVFRGAHEIGTAVILYGAPEKPTPAGHYPILAKYREHRSSLYDADMPFTLRLTNDGIAIHASNVREGYATHGCVGVPEAFAERLFDIVRRGDDVIIA